MARGDVPNEAELKRQILYAGLLGTALERSWRDAAAAGASAFKTLEKSGDTAFTGLADRVVVALGNGSREAAEGLLEELVEAMKKAPDKMKPHIKKLATVISGAVTGAGGSPAGSVGRMYQAESVTATRASHELYRVQALHRAAERRGLEGPAKSEFVAQAVAGNSRFNEFISLDERRAGIEASMQGAEKQKALALLDKTEARISGEMLRSKAEQVAHESVTARSNSSLVRAASGKGAGSDIVRSLLTGKDAGPFGLGASLRDMAQKQGAAAAAGEGVGGMAGFAGRAVEGIAGLVDAVAPLGVAMAAVGAGVALLIAGFDRARATGTAAFLALSAKGQATDDFYKTSANLYSSIYAATSNQRLMAGINGVDFDKMIQASLGAIAKTGIAVPGAGGDLQANLGNLVDSFNQIQEVGMLAGLSIDESFQLASQAARAFNLKDGNDTLMFFRRLTKLSADSQMSVRDFSAGLGDMGTLAAKYGDSVGAGFSVLSQQLSGAAGPGISDKMVGQSVARDIADTPLMNRLGLHMAATGVSIQKAALQFEGGASTPEQTLKDMMDVMHAKGLSGKGEQNAFGRLQLMLGMQGMGALKPAEVEALMTRKPLMDMMEKGVDSKRLLAEIDKSLASKPVQPTTALEAMGAQQGALEQLVGIARALLMWLTGSAFASIIGNEAGRIQAVKAASGGVVVPTNTRGAKAH